jgi:hypothetical protein
MPGMLRKSTAFVPRYQKFESISLQRTVRLSPAATFERREPRLSARVCEAGLGLGSQRRAGLSIARQPAGISLSGHIPVPQCRQWGRR